MYHSDGGPGVGEATFTTDRSERCGIQVDIHGRGFRLEFIVPFLDPVKAGLEEFDRFNLDFVRLAILLLGVQVTKTKDLTISTYSSIYSTPHGTHHQAQSVAPH
jgi:hypothetical protein